MVEEIRVTEMPTPSGPTGDHADLYQGVKAAIRSLPAYFDVDIEAGGIEASDVFGLGDIMGATIERQIVSTLERMRDVWDPDGDYKEYVWKRQSQTFPDAILEKPGAPEEDPLMGVEVKVWYLLAKEPDACFRFETSQEACTEMDLLTVVPWHLEHVVAGSPVLREPWVGSAKWAAKYVDYHWSTTRDTEKDRRVRYPEDVSPYPDKDEKIQKEPVEPTGGNYGRCDRSARGHDSPMGDWVKEMRSRSILGILINDWVEFFKESTQD